MKKSNYWREHEQSQGYYKKFNKFNALFESVINGTPIYQDIKNDPTLFFRKPDLHLICEDICKDHYIVSESTGDAVLLEECLFWTERQLIAEGILDKVFDAVKGIYEKIKEGIVKIITESSDAIKAFCEKIMNSKIVVAIRNKLGLDEKLDKEKFKKYIKIKNADGEEVNEVAEAAKDDEEDEDVISEVTKLSKKEEAITDPAEVQKYIDKYKDHLDGNKFLMNRHNHPLSRDYVRQRLRLFKKKLNELTGGNGQASSSSSSSSSASSANAAASSGSSAQSGNSSSRANRPAGTIIINEGINSVASRVGEQVTSNEAVNTASSTAAVAEGGDAARQELNNAQEQKPKGFFNKLGSKIKSGIQSVASSVSSWFAKQNDFVKMLIWGIIAIMAMFAIWWLVGAFIMPIVTVIIHGTLAQSAGAIFTVLMSGRTYYATFKAGKKAWTTGDGWGTFFMLLIGSVMATFALNGIANVGRNMMQQAAAKMVTQQQGENNGNGQNGQSQGNTSANKDASASGVRSGKTYDPDTGRLSEYEMKHLQREMTHAKQQFDTFGKKMPIPQVTKTGANSASISYYNPSFDQTYHDYLKQYAAEEHILDGDDWADAQKWASMMAKKQLAMTGGASYRPVGGNVHVGQSFDGFTVNNNDLSNF